MFHQNHFFIIIKTALFIKKMSGFFFFTIYSLSTDIILTSWNLSVYNITASSARLQWANFPLNVSISHFMVMFTEENQNISVLFNVNSLYDRSYHVQNMIKPYRMYKFQVLAFTGSIENETYSTEIQSVLTGEGGTACVHQ